MDTRERVYDFLIGFKIKHQGNTPTVEQIRKGCEISSTSVVQYHIEHLHDEGRILRTGRNIYIPGAHWTPPERKEG